MAGAANQPRIVKREWTSSKEKHGNGYRLSPEAKIGLVGVILLPFLIPVANFICSIIGLLFQFWIGMVSSSLANIFWTTFAFMKVLGMGIVILFVVLAVLYQFSIGESFSKRGAVDPGFGDFCLSMAYTVGVPVPGTVINLLSNDGQ